MERYVSVGFLIFLGMAATLVWISAQAILLDREIGQDINGYLARAETATTAEQMGEMIDGALEGLDEWNMHEGSWCWIYDTPETRMEYAILQLEGLRDRLQVIEATESRGSMGYAESLEEIKRSFGDISIEPYEFYTLYNVLWLYPAVVIAEWTLIALFGILFAMMFSDAKLIPGRWICKIRGHKFWGSTCHRCDVPNPEYKEPKWK